MDRKVVVALISVLVLNAAGCGGSKQPTNSAFVTQADTLCQRIKQQTRQLGVQAGHQTGGQAAQLQTKLIVLLREMHRGLDAIDPPAGLRADYDQYKATLAEQIQRIEHPSSTPGTEEALHHREISLVAALGFKHCS